MIYGQKPINLSTDLTNFINQIKMLIGGSLIEKSILTKNKDKEFINKINTQVYLEPSIDPSLNLDKQSIYLEEFDLSSDIEQLIDKRNYIKNDIRRKNNSLTYMNEGIKLALDSGDSIPERVEKHVQEIENKIYELTMKEQTLTTKINELQNIYKIMDTATNNDIDSIILGINNFKYKLEELQNSKYKSGEGLENIFLSLLNEFKSNNNYNLLDVFNLREGFIKIIVDFLNKNCRTGILKLLGIDKFWIETFEYTTTTYVDFKLKTVTPKFFNDLYLKYLEIKYKTKFDYSEQISSEQRFLLSYVKGSIDLANVDLKPIKEVKNNSNTLNKVVNVVKTIYKNSLISKSE